MTGRRTTAVAHGKRHVCDKIAPVQLWLRDANGDDRGRLETAQTRTTVVETRGRLCDSHSRQQTEQSLICWINRPAVIPSVLLWMTCQDMWYTIL